MLSETRPQLGAPVVPFYPFSFWVPLLKPNSREKGTLIIKGLLGNLVSNWLAVDSGFRLPVNILSPAVQMHVLCMYMYVAACMYN